MEIPGKSPLQKTKRVKNVAVIGAGRWGRNLVRNFAQLGSLYAVCDASAAAREETPAGIRCCGEFREILQDPAVDGVVIAVPASLHYAMAREALMAGKDVMVEKPLAMDPSQGQDLVETAHRQKRILMVDHLLQYHPAVIKLKDLIDTGSLGKIQYIYSNRLNIGRLRHEENILFSFAPHDISVILFLLGRFPRQVRVFGEAYLQDHIYDTTITYLDFQDRLKAHIFVSWLHPYKEQKLIVIGSLRMAVFDDMSREKLMVYPHRIEWIKQIPVAARAEAEPIPVQDKEPLNEACRHFLECMSSRSTPRTDGREALAVLKVLYQAQQYLDDGKYRESEHRLHPSLQ